VTNNIIKFTDSSGKVWPVPAHLFETYAERVTLYTTREGRPAVHHERPAPSAVRKK